MRWIAKGLIIIKLILYIDLWL